MGINSNDLLSATWDIFKGILRAGQLLVESSNKKKLWRVLNSRIQDSERTKIALVYAICYSVVLPPWNLLILNDVCNLICFI